MAGPGENIEITITGDAKDLTEALEKVSKNIEELQAGLGGAKDSFEKTGKSAQDAMKKVEAETKKASTATDGLTSAQGKSSKATDSLAKSTEKASKKIGDNRKILGMQVSSLESGADAMGRMDSAFSSFASVIDQVNPALAENLRVVGDLTGASEQLILSFTQLGPKGLVIAAAAAAGTAAYTELMATQQRVIDKNQQLADGYDVTISSLLNMEKLEMSMSDQLAVATGQITEQDIALRKRTQTIERAMRVQRKEAMKRASQKETLAEFQVAYEKEIAAIADTERRLKQLSAELHHTNTMQKASTHAATAHAMALLEVDVSATTGAKAIEVLTGLVDESTGEQLKAVGGYQKSEYALSLLEERFKKEAEVVVEGTNQKKRLHTTVEFLNMAMDDLRAAGSQSTDMFKALSETTDGVSKSYGAVNISTGQFIDISQLAIIAAQRQLELLAHQAREQEELAAKRKARARERLSLLEQLEQQAFDTENALKNPIIALEDAHEREMEQLDKLVAKYKEDAKVMEATERLKDAKLREFTLTRFQLMREEEERIKSLAREARSALETIESISEGGARDTFEEEFKALEEYYSRQKELLAESVQDAMATQAETHDIVKAAKDEELQIEQEFLDAKKALEDKYADDQRDQLNKLEDERMEKLLNNLSAMQNVFGGMETIILAFDEAITFQSVESQKRMFAAAKAAAISEAIIAGAVAGIATFKDGGITPVNLAEAAALAVTTAATVATIAAEQPSFDIGGVVRGGVMAQSRDQVSANLLPGEAVLNRRATEALGEQGVNALNSGGTVGSQVVVVPAYKHFDRFIKDEYRRGGSFRNIVTKQREFPVGRRSY